MAEGGLLLSFRSGWCGAIVKDVRCGSRPATLELPFYMRCRSHDSGEEFPTRLYNHNITCNPSTPFKSTIKRFLSFEAKRSFSQSFQNELTATRTNSKPELRRSDFDILPITECSLDSLYRIPVMFSCNDKTLIATLDAFWGTTSASTKSLKSWNILRHRQS